MRIALAAYLILAVTPSQAVEPERLLSNFHHTAWTAKDGAPADIWALAQTLDGWLWIGSSAGLYRFDGVRFERMEAITGHKLLSGNVLALMADGDGGLWVGYRFGGISHFRAGQVWHYGEHDGLPPRSILAIDKAQDGTVWAATSNGIAFLRDARWQMLGMEVGLPDDIATQVVSTYPAGLLVGTRRSGAYLRPPGQTRFHKLALDDSANVFLVTPDQSLLAANDASGLFKFSDTRQQFSALPLRGEKIQRSAMLVDREGALWTATTGALRRSLLHRPDSAAQYLSVTQGLSGENIQVMLEDREGSVWLGTTGGLDRIRRNKLVSAPLPPELQHLGITKGERGAVWAGGAPYLVEIAADGRQTRHEHILPTTLYTDPSDVAWIGTSEGIWRFEGGASSFFALPSNMKGSDIQALSRDGKGGLWVSVAGKGIYLLKDGQWIARGGRTDLPDGAAITILVDGAGRAWFGFPGDRIALLEANRVRLLGSEQGLRVGNVLSLASRGDRVWVGGEGGVAYFDGTRFVPLTGRHGEPLLGVSGIVETAAGDVWLHGIEGISRVTAADLRRYVQAPTLGAPLERLNYEDGLVGVAMQIRPVPSLIEGSDGRIWYVTSAAAGWIDPLRIRRNALAPPLAITSLMADGKVHPLAAANVLPKGTSKLHIRFAALSLTIPERVRFRYRLEGVDRVWQDPSGRREAFYTNLGPGKYRFTVLAANEDGVWNETGASLALEIPPTFVQTPWFVLLVIVMVLGLLYLLYLLRLRQVTSRIRERAHERQIERERIARAVHDTLLQGMQGLMLRLQIAGKHAHTDADKAQAMIEQVLDQADQLMAEGRDQIMALRADIQFADGIPRALGLIGTTLADEHGNFFQLLIEGEPRDIQCAARDAIYGIGREALFNAYRHAQARKIELELIYGAEHLQLRIGDDGRGLDQAELEAAQRPGHWGWAGMRERADRIGAQLDIWSQPDKGTEVVLKVPAEQAYAPQRSGFWSVRHKPA
ncbi:ligand-binding sensor domain-containing protein [Chitinimonas naiadis]